MKKFILISIFSLASLITVACSDKKSSSHAADLVRCTENSVWSQGKRFPSEDGCNTCHCDERGAVVCTKKACGEASQESSPCKDAIATYQMFTSKFDREENRGCSQDSDCVLKILGHTPCSLPRSYPKRLFTSEVNADIERLLSRVSGTCPITPYGAGCGNVMPHNKVECRQNLCQSTFVEPTKNADGL